MKRKTINRGKIAKIIISATLWLFAAAIVVTNFFIPVKYLSAYVGFGQEAAATGVLRVIFPDTQGSCALIEFPDGKSMLIDGGNGTYSSRLKLFKALNGSGIKKLDYLICTSPKEEHSGGLREVVKYKEPDKIFLPFVPNSEDFKKYAEFSAYLTRKHKSAEEVFANYGFYNKEYGYAFSILSPFASVKAQAFPNRLTEEQVDSLSVVIYVEYENIGLLLLSDCSLTALQELVNAMTVGFYSVEGREINFSDCKIIQAANHGSSNGAYSPLYDLLKPETAIIPVYKEQPSVSAIMNFGQYATVYRTDEHGTITLTISDGGYRVN